MAKLCLELCLESWRPENKFACWKYGNVVYIYIYIEPLVGLRCLLEIVFMKVQTMWYLGTDGGPSKQVNDGDNSGYQATSRGYIGVYVLSPTHTPITDSNM